MYRAGDYAYVEDLPHVPFLCRVTDAETFRDCDGVSQILTLAPLEGPWPKGTNLIRLDHAVRAVDVRAHWQAGLTARRRPTSGRQGRSGARRAA